MGEYDVKNINICYFIIGLCVALFLGSILENSIIGICCGLAIGVGLESIKKDN